MTKSMCVCVVALFSYHTFLAGQYIVDFVNKTSHETETVQSDTVG